MLGAVPCSRKSGKLNLLISLISSFWVFRGVSKNLEISWRGVNNLRFLSRTLSYMFLKRKASNVAWMAFKFGAGKATHSHLSQETSKAQQIQWLSIIQKRFHVFSAFQVCFAEFMADPDRLWCRNVEDGYVRRHRRPGPKNPKIRWWLWNVINLIISHLIIL